MYNLLGYMCLQSGAKTKKQEKKKLRSPVLLRLVVLVFCYCDFFSLTCFPIVFLAQ